MYVFSLYKAVVWQSISSFYFLSPLSRHSFAMYWLIIKNGKLEIEICFFLRTYQFVDKSHECSTTNDDDWYSLSLFLSRHRRQQKENGESNYRFDRESNCQQNAVFSSIVVLFRLVTNCTIYSIHLKKLSNFLVSPKSLTESLKSIASTVKSV